MNEQSDINQRYGNGEREYLCGYFCCFVEEHAELVCPINGNRYVFGPEAIDLGPCCDPCDENWKKILKNDDLLVFCEGCSYQTGDGVVRTAKQVIFPYTRDYYGNFLGVVLRERHPKSKEGAMAAFFCPPFGIITLHKFAFGHNPHITWPLIVGSRFWVKPDMSEASIKVWKVEGEANDVEFYNDSTRLPFAVPKLCLWQWNKTFNQTGIFALTEFIPEYARNTFITITEIEETSSPITEARETTIPTTPGGETDSSTTLAGGTSSQIKRAGKTISSATQTEETSSQISAEGVEKDPRCSSCMPTFADGQKRREAGKEERSPHQGITAAKQLLLDLINDTEIRQMVIDKHEKAFENFLTEEYFS